MRSISKEDVTARLTIEGAWRISAVVGNYLETRRYYGYDMDEAIGIFLEEIEEKKDAV